MGLEKVCLARLDGQTGEGKAHCGDGEVDFKGEFRFRWKWSELTSRSIENGTLRLFRNGQVAELHLGEDAAKWLHQIENPKSRLDKFGLKPGHAYDARGEFDESFPSELANRAGEPDASRFRDIVFVRLDSRDDLPKLLDARKDIVQNGMIWAVWPKGRKELREDDIRNFALANGLVDVKVASFNEALSSLKLVIPVAMRK